MTEALLSPPSAEAEAVGSVALADEQERPTPADGASSSTAKRGLEVETDGQNSDCVPADDRLAGCLRELTRGLTPYVEHRLRRIYRDRWTRVARDSFRGVGPEANRDSADQFAWDAHGLLTVMWDQWNTVFRHELGHAERSLVSELRDFRNRWAHQSRLDFNDTYRACDSVRRLLTSVGAENLREVEALQEGLIASHVEEQVNAELRKSAFHDQTWWSVWLYVICCGVILLSMTLSGLTPAGTGANWPPISTVVVVFIYLIYKQYRREPPKHTGPRECRRCRRIIYDRTCPYC